MNSELEEYEVGNLLDNVIAEEAFRHYKAEGSRRELKVERLDQRELRLHQGELSEEKVTPAQEERGQLHLDEVQPLKVGGPSSGSGQRELVDIEEQFEANHNDADQEAFEAVTGAQSIKAAKERDVEDIRPDQTDVAQVQWKADNPLSKMRNSIGSGRSSATSADDVLIENAQPTRSTTMQLTDGNSVEDMPAIQMLPPVQNLMTRTLNSIDDPRKKKLQRIEWQVTGGGGGERVGLSHDQEKSGTDLTDEGERGEETMETAQATIFRKHGGEKTEERSEEKRMRTAQQQAARGAANHNDEGLKVVSSSGSQIFEVEKLPLSERLEGGRLGSRGGDEDLALTKLKPTEDKEKGVEANAEKKAEENEEKSEEEKMNIEDQVFLLPAGHGLFFKMKLRRSKKPLLSFLSHV